MLCVVSALLVHVPNSGKLVLFANGTFRLMDIDLTSMRKSPVHVLHMAVSSDLCTITVIVEVLSMVEVMRIALPIMWQQRHAIMVSACY